jgi:hypothetical protein
VAFNVSGDAHIVDNKTGHGKVSMLTDTEINEWMDDYIWTQVIELLLHDAYFKLVRRIAGDGQIYRPARLSCAQRVHHLPTYGYPAAVRQSP